MKTPIQRLRHDARDNAHATFAALAGVQGIDKAGQVARLEQAKTSAEATLAAVNAALDLASQRDFDAYMAEKTAGLATEAGAEA